MAKKTDTKAKSLDEVLLGDFKKNNSICSYSSEGNNLIIENPWGSEDSCLVFDINDTSTIQDLNNVILPHGFDMLIHKDSNTAEVFYGYLLPDKDPYKLYIDLSFEFHFAGVQFTCTFAEPSKRFMTIANSFKRNYNDIDEPVVPQIDIFKDSLRIKKLPKGAQDYFSKRVPRNFFIKASKPFEEVDMIRFARHLNFSLRYYDRSSPEIVIRSNKEDTQKNKGERCRFIEQGFPKAISIEPLDDFMLQLIEVARITNFRFAFVYYYQVIEYAGFYFLDNKAKRDLRQLLRDPAMVSCTEDKLTQLFVFLSDISHGDDVKMKRVIEEYCNPAVVWKEIENDKEYFTTVLSFDGGFELSPLISKDTSAETWSTMWMPKVYDHLTKIRNCLVHAREKRQSNVILPTKANNHKIRRYLPIIARIAEQIALNKE